MHHSLSNICTSCISVTVTLVCSCDKRLMESSYDILLAWSGEILTKTIAHTRGVKKEMEPAAEKKILEWGLDLPLTASLQVTKNRPLKVTVKVFINNC